ncbi:ABC transporter ATP-binding protein [Variovorax saccharolyticus]|uniref:ABC transporter ATP-binding protein n=1 Tax=Variovorax saccharolyticus TaxID=3053516 RepID=UPI0025783A27|nr:ABC transporter ATP-binding protein [Variovorax sp. J22R187]MDM0021451.1 ABC transporter ATP-binding protein [Variovorax sp. J22R187]
MAGSALLEVEDLDVVLHTRSGRAKAIDRMSFSVSAGETLAIVGESGCGKSLTALSVLGLLPQPQVQMAGGAIRLLGRDLARLSERELQDVRGRDVAMIFQDPMSSLNPVRTVGAQLVEMLQAHERIGNAAAWQRAQRLLEQVSIPNAQARLHEYPHRLSGGMCQRVMIAMAIACQPRLLIADEPTTALDVTIQAQILALLAQIQRESGMGLVIITHDLGVVAEVADRVLVMYAGRKVEEAPVQLLFDAPQHPYTRGLLAATPSPLRPRGSRLADIPGMVADLSALPTGCAFADRCPRAFDRCLNERPSLVQVGAGQQAACFAVDAAEEIEWSPA